MLLDSGIGFCSPDKILGFFTLNGFGGLSGRLIRSREELLSLHLSTRVGFICVKSDIVGLFVGHALVGLACDIDHEFTLRQGQTVVCLWLDHLHTSNPSTARLQLV